METTYDFLALLELDQSAHERDIRRAYARKLKRIDQEADPDGFQALRNAYEVALDWARWKLAQEAPQTEPPTPSMPAPEHAAAPEQQPPAQEEEPPEAMRLGGEVFGRLGASAKVMAAAGKLGDVDAWRAAIEARFADEELINIDARIYFEAFVASMLANGWRQGHEALFVAAKDSFGWDGDRRRLWQLGQSGRFLDQAIEERHLFDALPAEEQVRMRDLARMLRSEGLPARREILRSMRETERMLARFPALMAVVTDMENVERWRAIYREAGGKPIDPQAEESPAPVLETHGSSSWKGWLFALALFAVLRLVFNSSGGETTRPPAQFPRLQDLATGFVGAAVLDQLAPPERIATPKQTVRQLDVVYRVFLTVDRQVRLVEARRLSGDPGLDQAVREALLAAGIFPLGTPREFLVRYTHGGEKTGWMDASAKKPGVPKGDVIKAHVAPVSFKIADGTSPGVYEGEYGVTVDAAGVVTAARTIKSSGIGGLDEAMLDAARKAMPFAPGTPSFAFGYQIEVHAPGKGRNRK